jgi:hypothetical protein
MNLNAMSVEFCGKETSIFVALGALGLREACDVDGGALPSSQQRRRPKDRARPGLLTNVLLRSLEGLNLSGFVIIDTLDAPAARLR